MLDYQDGLSSASVTISDLRVILGGGAAAVRTHWARVADGLAQVNSVRVRRACALCSGVVPQSWLCGCLQHLNVQRLTKGAVS